jgi:hypothetical protein
MVGVIDASLMAAGTQRVSRAAGYLIRAQPS